MLHALHRKQYRKHQQHKKWFKLISSTGIWLLFHLGQLLFHWSGTRRDGLIGGGGKDVRWLFQSHSLTNKKRVALLRVFFAEDFLIEAVDTLIGED